MILRRTSENLRKLPWSPKLQPCLFPGHRASIGSLVIVFLDGEYRIALEEYLDTTRHLLRETLAEFFVGPDCDLAQQGLHVLANNTLWHVLRRGYFPVNEGDCCHVWETMVGLFLGTYLVFVTFLSSTNDVKGHIKDGDLDTFDLLRAQLVGLSQFQDAFEGRL